MARRTSTSVRTGTDDALVAGIKTPELVLQDVRRRLTRTWPEVVLAECGISPTGTDAPPSRTGERAQATQAWPHAFPLGQPSAELLASTFGQIVSLVRDWREWADRHEVTLLWRSRRVHGTEQELPTHLHVEDIDTATRLTGRQHVLESARTRARGLIDHYPRLVSPAGALRQVLDYEPVDFDLLCRAADWFAARAETARAETGRAETGRPQPLTPRQVPIEGLHAKWLDTRHALLRNLTGLDDLDLLPAHPPRLHFTYLDPHHLATGGRRHDCATVGDHLPLPYTPRLIVISENKDTAVHFPPVPSGVAVEGSGRGGATAASFPWITEAEAVFYWGDLDPDGFEILDGFRAAGVPARSLLMDRVSYDRWERYGTHVDRRGTPLPPRDPRPTPHLSAAERALYEDLCSPQWTRHRRVEQERIPLHIALETVRAVAHTDTDQ
ncbi:Wadjet anti-phage system protein JetD domain-containing protein [Saccharothrix sp. Mg75]|uniref:Wadjet anti-phage system protein JetD domain-containing protein n=1 Tax=Saccharothrix sp. Mg75 TaxID=3445357 RepID=UPI003EE886AF